MKPHERRITACCSKLRLPAKNNQKGVDIAEYDAPTGSHDPTQLSQCIMDIRKMHEREGAYGRIDTGILERKIAEIAFMKLRLGNFTTRLPQHLRRSIDADDAVTPIDEKSAVAPGSARCIEDDRRRQRIDQLQHGRIFDGKQSQRLVIRLRPESVALRDVVLGAVYRA